MDHDERREIPTKFACSKVKGEVYRMNRGERREIPAKFTGLKVKSMIETVEQKMAEGETIPAGPESKEEAKALQRVREENQKSKNRADNT